MTQHILSVKQINSYIKASLEQDPNLAEFWVRGEISNYTLHRSGHMYFSIKEQGSVLKAVMFAGNTRSLRFLPKDGTKVIIRGNISVYEPSGQYQLVVREMQPDGIGNLHLAYEQLKEQLREEGLFDESVKQPLPRFPKTIGIVTSPTGAALHDMVTTIKRRYPIANILFFPAQVQGESAPRSIVEGIQTMNEYGKADVLIVGRGGGSIEDLWGFNDESVARAIFASNIPVISAVGHETDFTIADFVADMRAPTPTAAAEIATPYTVSELSQTVNYYQQTYKKTLVNTLKTQQERWKRTHQTLQYFHPKKVHETNIQKHDLLHEKLLQAMKNQLEEKQKQYLLTLTKLDGLSPLKIMSRGFSAVYKEETLVKSVQNVQPQDEITIRLQDGQVHCIVKEVEQTEEETV